MEKVAVVIVTYNRLQMLKEEIESVRKQRYNNFEIIVVDNGSTDDTPAWLSQQNDIITLTQDNQGCSGGMFTGIKYAVEHKFDLCWVMDDDVEYRDNSLEELVRSYHLLNGKVGFLCSKVEGINGVPMNVPVVDMRPTDNGYSHYYDMIDSFMIKVRVATFVSLLFNCRIVKEMGLPIKEFFIWGDDSEFTYRISNHYPCYLCCKSIAIHKRAIQGDILFHTETDPRRLRNFFYMFRNQAYTIRYHQGLKPFIHVYLSYLKKFLYYTFKFDISKARVLLKVLLKTPAFTPKVVFPK